MNINKFAEYCGAMSYHGVFDDSNWKWLGYNERPKFGHITKIFLSQSKVNTVNRLIDELHLLGFIDVVCSCIDSDILFSDFYDARILSVVGMMDNIYALTKNKDPDKHIDFLMEGYQDYIITEKSFADTIFERLSKEPIDIKIELLMGFSVIIHESCRAQIGLVFPRKIIFDMANKVEMKNGETLNVRLNEVKRGNLIKWAHEVADYRKKEYYPFHNS